MQAKCSRLVFFFGKRRRIDSLQDDLAAAVIDKLVDQLTDPLRVTANLGQVTACFLRKVQVDRYRFLQAFENVKGALAEGVKAVLGQVEPKSFEKIA